ncbi:thioesterase [Mycobacterium antarcticum]|nr:thioesterase [Mycolicibacterium sp. TUM20983]
MQAPGVHEVIVRHATILRMTARPAHFTPSTEDTFLPTASAQSHWGDDHLNGPALVGLAAWVLDGRYGDDDFLPTRLTVDLFKAARGVPTVVSTRLIRDGRRVRTSECELSQDGRPVVRATMVQYRLSSAPAGEQWRPATTFPHPEVDAASYMRMGSDEGGWSDAIADHQNASRKRFFNRSVDVVDGQCNGPFVDAVMVAEGTSLVTNLGSAGIGYINGDLTVGLTRLPGDEWIGVQAESHWAQDGIAVGTATLFDAMGPFGSGMVTAVSNPAAQIDFTHDQFPSRTP